MSKHCTIMKRMKDNYESRQTYYLTRRVPVIIRLDGKAFHTYTRDLNKPFDKGFVEDMNQTAIYLCQNIQCAKCAYVQSDEISILVTDYDKLETNAWFDYNKSKMESISAGMSSAKFNQLRLERHHREIEAVGDNENLYRMELAVFDSRATNYPKEEVANYFLARQKDCVKNSIATVAQSLYSHTELNEKNQSEQQEMIFQKGINWNDFDSELKRGRFIVKQIYVNNELSLIKDNKIYLSNPYNKWVDITEKDTVRSKWEVVETPLNFSNKDFEKWL